MKLFPASPFKSLVSTISLGYQAHVDNFPFLALTYASAHPCKTCQQWFLFYFTIAQPISISYKVTLDYILIDIYIAVLQILNFTNTLLSLSFSLIWSLEQQGNMYTFLICAMNIYDINKIKFKTKSASQTHLLGLSDRKQVRSSSHPIALGLQPLVQKFKCHPWSIYQTQKVSFITHGLGNTAVGAKAQA
jgi:hypothetical protein